MRAFVNNEKMTKFMQCAGVFEKGKVIYEDLDLNYELNGEILEDEESILYLAKKEWGENLIALFGKEKPLFINQEVRVISNGKQWTRLLDALKSIYPHIKFSTDQYLFNIEFEYIKQAKELGII
jgi:hypothetical protein